MYIKNKSSETYDFLTKNYIPWTLASKELEFQKKIKTEVENTDFIENFYKNSNLVINNFIKNVNIDSRTHKTIVYIAGKCYPMISRQAEFMRANGYKTYLVSMETLSIQNLEMIKDSFDEIIQGCIFYPTLGKILNSVHPSFFHVQCWMWQYHLGKFVIEKNLKSKVISEFYDVTGMYASSDDLSMVFPKHLIKQDFEYEKFIFENSDGIIHRYKESIFINYAKRYKKRAKILEFQQYPIKIVNSEYKLPQKNQKYKFVFCGTLIPPNDPNHPHEIFNPAGLFYTFKKILQSDHEINVYQPLNSNLEFNSWLFDLKNKSFPNTLKIHDFLPISELINEISKFDFGINYQKIDIKKTKVSQDTYQGAMGTKNHTYLEAGLPIIVNKEYKYHDQIVTKNKIGLSLKSEDLSNFNFLIKNANIKELKKNVRKFNIRNSLDKKGKDLLSFFESL